MSGCRWWGMWLIVMSAGVSCSVLRTSTRDKHALVQNNFSMHTWLLTTGDRGPFRSLRNSSLKLSALKEYSLNKIGLYIYICRKRVVSTFKVSSVQLVKWSPQTEQSYRRVSHKKAVSRERTMPQCSNHNVNIGWACITHWHGANFTRVLN